MGEALELLAVDRFTRARSADRRQWEHTRAYSSQTHTWLAARERWTTQIGGFADHTLMRRLLRFAPHDGGR